jgi:ATP-dependent RNA helicase DDX19/DBP5
MLSCVDEAKQQPQCICICNSLELADQVFAEVTKMAKYTKISIGTVLKGLKPGAEVNDQVLIGTPGKFKDLLAKKKIKTAAIRMFVIDEADAMLEDDNMRSQAIVIRKNLPKTTRVLLFSATYTEENKHLERDEDKAKELQILEFADKIVPEPRQLILVPREKLTLEYMRQYFVEVASDHEKYNVLKSVYEELNVGQSIIFVNKRTTAEEIKKKLEAEKFPCAMLHGQLDVADRKRVMADFREAKAKLLLSTNVIARGLDVSSVTHVVNYDLPVTQEGQPDVATYLHRIGRTARFGRKGVAINICATRRDSDIIGYFQKYFGITITRADKDEIDEQIK